MTRTPHCLLCFLDNDFQAELRRDVQHLSHRHERVLQAYADRLHEIFGKLGSVNNCPHHTEPLEHFTWWVETYRSSLAPARIRQIAEGLISVYHSWLKGTFGDAFATLDNFLSSLNYVGHLPNPLSKSLMFRGRKGMLSREELLHIPFNKRYCITNQRYSVAGQPLLYLGLSILDVACEIGADPLKIDDYSFSYYWLKDPGTVRLLDLGNRVHEMLWNSVRPICAAGSQFKNLSPNESFHPSRPAYQQSFDSFLISSMCSFRRVEVTRQDAFASEYVLPQALAHWARVNAFDAILYTSTRIDSNQWTIRGYLHLNRYRENLAFFTNYDPASDDEHDFSLLNRFEISPAFQLGSASAVSRDELLSLRNTILQKGGPHSLPEQIQRSGIDVDTAFQDLVHINTGGATVRYDETDCGKLQRYLQYRFMNARLSS